ncbi:hypothetical protein [Streptomyces syringium]|uniref:hypothetical protein n=1 Tax=Streptomyces syringium TaxID=76729 RepID=UPI0037D2F55D
MGGADRVLHGEAGDPGSLVPARLAGRLTVGVGDPPAIGLGEVGGAEELVGSWGPAAGLGNGGLTAVVGQGAVCDVVVQAARELLPAQGLQQMPAGSARTWRRANLPRTVETTAATSTAASTVSTSGSTRARIAAPAARQR